MRRGTAAFTALAGATQRFHLAHKPAVDLYIERMQQLMAIEGLACVGDVSNPTVFGAAAPPPLGQPQRSAGVPGLRPPPGMPGRSPVPPAPFVNIVPPPTYPHAAPRKH